MPDITERSRFSSDFSSFIKFLPLETKGKRNDNDLVKNVIFAITMRLHFMRFWVALSPAGFDYFSRKLSILKAVQAISDLCELNGGRLGSTSLYGQVRATFHGHLLGLVEGKEPWDISSQREPFRSCC